MADEKTIDVRGSLTIDEIRAKTIALNNSIQSQLVAFESDTGCEVHSVQVHHDRPPTVRTVVKVQIPGVA